VNDLGHHEEKEGHKVFFGTFAFFAAKFFLFFVLFVSFVVAYSGDLTRKVRTFVIRVRGSWSPARSRVTGTRWSAPSTALRAIGSVLATPIIHRSC